MSHFYLNPALSPCDWMGAARRAPSARAAIATFTVRLKISAGFSKARKTDGEIHETVEAGSGHERHRCRLALDDARCGAGSTCSGCTCDGQRPPGTGGARRLALTRLRLCGQDHGRGPRSCSTSPADFCHADPRPEPDPDKLFVFYRFLDRTRSRSRARSDRPATYSTGLADLPAACTVQAQWTAPRIAALVGATFAEPLSLVCRARHRLAGANGGG